MVGVEQHAATTFLSLHLDELLLRGHTTRAVEQQRGPTIAEGGGWDPSVAGEARDFARWTT